MRAKSVQSETPNRPLPEKDRSYTVSGQLITAPRAVPGLHLVATPIGNLGDITLRALETLAGVDIVACEDTRISRRLMERYGISATLWQYHEHNAVHARPEILSRLAQGASIALISDAGTPMISDPGYRLVREVYDAGHDVITLPGPSSVLAALTLAALPTDSFFFDGFLPSKQLARRARLSELARIPATLVVFEAGTRVQESVRDMALTLPGREVALCRELTKMHQEVRRGQIADIAQTADELETRGEFVIVIAPPDASASMSQLDIDAILREVLANSSVKDAVAHAMEVSGRPRREIYARALELSKDMRATDSDD